jgi:excisionase family DNA binding protein
MTRRKVHSTADVPLSVATNAEDKNVGVQVPTRAVSTRRLFSVGAAAKYLGISDDTLRKYVALGLIPAYRFLNGNRAFKREDLDELIARMPLWNDHGRDTTRAGSSEVSQ